MITMSSLVEFAHTVQAEPDEVFDAWLADRNLSEDQAALARETFHLGRSYQLAADTHALAQRWVKDPELRHRRLEAGQHRRRFTDVAAVHRESSRVPEKFQEG